MEMQNEVEHLVSLELIRRTSEAAYVKNPHDADNLTRWGEALLRLSQFQDSLVSMKMIQDAIEKLEEALVLDPVKLDALWWIGNAYTSNGLLIPDPDDAKGSFDKAVHYYEQALVLDPQNETYGKSLEIAYKCPELHAEIHKHAMGQQAMGPGPSGTKQNPTKQSKNSDLKYDIFGWMILAAGIVTWLRFVRANMPPPPGM